MYISLTTLTQNIIWISQYFSIAYWTNVDKVIHNWQDVDFLENNNLAVKISYSGGNF